MTPGPPTSELGAVTRGTDLLGLSSWIVSGGGYDETEHVPDLAWPLSREVYLRMSRSTGLKHLIRSVELPILGMHFWLDPQDCDEQTAANIARDLGIGVGEDGEPEKTRTAGRFDLRQHLRWALAAPLVYGHAVFEQVGETTEGGPRDGWTRLKKLAPRPQSTIEGFDVAADGGLNGVQQLNPKTGLILNIPVNRLVVYTHEMQPGVWVGEPLLRSCYESWFLRDVLVRLDVTKHDRNSMGVPTANPREGQTPSKTQQADALAQMTNVRAGDMAGLVGSEVYEFAMQGVSGATSDPLESVKYHDQMLSKQFLAMVMDVVSSETGNRAVSGTVEDKFDNGVQAIAQGIVDTFNAHVIEDLVDWQGDPTAPAPALRFSSGDPEDVSDFLFNAVDKGLITPDDELEAWARERAELPERTTPRTPPPSPPPVPPPGFGDVTAETAGDTNLPAPDGVQVEAAATVAPGAFTRDPTAFEVQAAVDFTALTERWRRSALKLAEQVAGERLTIGQKLAGQVADLLASGDVEAARALPIPAVGVAAMTAAFTKAVDEGAADHLKEAKAQGAKTAAADLAAARLAAEKRASLVGGQLGSQLLGVIIDRASNASGPAATAGSIATAAQAAVTALSDATVVKEVGAGIVASTGEGRVAQMQANPGTWRYVASELLDGSTCLTCESVDGDEYLTLEDALSDYPSGAQYVGCEGGSNCRGLIVAISVDESAPTLQEPGDE